MAPPTATPGSALASSFTHKAINSSMASPKPLADQQGYLIGMRLSFKPNVIYETRNLWSVNVYSTSRRQNSVVNKKLIRG